MKQGINLIPASVQTTRARRARLRLWIVVDAALCLAAGLLFVVARPHTDGLTDRLRSDHEAARSELAGTQEQLALVVERLRTARARDAVARRIGARPDFSGLLQTMALELDSRASLVQVLIAPLAVEPEPPLAQGAAPGGTGGPPDPSAQSNPVGREQYRVLISGIATSAGIASGFVLRLDQTGYFSDVSLVSTNGREIEGIRAVEFQIAGTLGETRLASTEDAP